MFFDPCLWRQEIRFFMLFLASSEWIFSIRIPGTEKTFAPADFEPFWIIWSCWFKDFLAVVVGKRQRSASASQDLGRGFKYCFIFIPYSGKIRNLTSNQRLTCYLICFSFHDVRNHRFWNPPKTLFSWQDSGWKPLNKVCTDISSIHVGSFSWHITVLRRAFMKILG